MNKNFFFFKKITFVIAFLFFLFIIISFSDAQTDSSDQNFFIQSNQFPQLIVFSATGSYYAYIYPVVNPLNNQVELFKAKVHSASGDFEVGPFNQILQHGLTADGRIYLAIGIEIRENNIYYIVYINKNKLEYRLF